MEKRDKIRELMALNLQYIYMPKYKCFWIDCYGEHAKLFTDTIGTILAGIDHSLNHYLVVDQMENINKTKLLGGVGNKGSTNQYRTQNRIYSSSSSSSINTGFNPYVADEGIELNIRKLTPRETGRLMGVHDEDINLLKEHLSDAELYHCFGDSIVVNVLMAIFSQMLDINWINKFKEIENAYIKEK